MSEPKFPQFICPRGENGCCNFEVAGAGFQCLTRSTNDGCGLYVHPGDKGFAELRRYHEWALGEGEARPAAPPTREQLMRLPAASLADQIIALRGARS